MSKTYAKIGTWRGVESPAHWHEPFAEWQWPWQEHQAEEANHRHHDVANPVWVAADTKNPTKPGVKTIKPTAAMKKAYAEALIPGGAAQKRILAAFKAAGRKDEPAPVIKLVTDAEAPEWEAAGFTK